MTDVDCRRATLQAREQKLHELYMASNINSPEEAHLALALEDVMAELEALWRTANRLNLSEW